MIFLKRDLGRAGEGSRQQREIDDNLRDMLALLRKASGGGVSQEFARKLKFLDDNRADIEKGIVAWINLIEVIVQGAEQRYPDGYGSRKKAQVKSALQQIISSEKFEIPRVPHYLQPFVMDIVIDWCVEVVYTNVDHYDLWDDSRPQPWSLGGTLRTILGWTLKSLEPLAEVFSWLYVKLRYSEPLTPELKAAVQRVIDAHLLSEKRAFFGAPTDVVMFVANHGPQLVAATKLFFKAVHEAERFLSYSGPEKKAYARDLIIGVLEELGFPVREGLFGAVVRAFIDAAIESAWSIFDKRAPEAFRHRSGKRAPA